MNKIKISPSILSADFSQLGSEIKKLEEGGADLIHVDVMDGHFVPNLTIGPPVIKALRNYSTLPFDVHLMISPVHKYIKDYADAGADIITIHPEATENLEESINLIKKLNKKIGLSLNPDTPINIIKKFLPSIDLVLIMSVYPGFGGQKFIPKVIDKIKELKNIKEKQNIKFDIEVDGGIDFDNSKLVVDKIFFTLSFKSILLFSLDLMTDLIIERSVLNKSPVTVTALVSFGKQEPPKAGPALKKRLPILLSKPIPKDTSSTFTPIFSHKFASSFI